MNTSPTIMATRLSTAHRSPDCQPFGSSAMARSGSAHLRPVRRDARHLNRQRGVAIHPDRPRTRSGGRGVGRERLRPGLRGSPPALGTCSGPVGTAAHVRRRLGSVHRGHRGGRGLEWRAAADRGAGPAGCRCCGAQPGRNVPVADQLPGRGASQGDEHVGRRLDARRDNGCRRRRPSRRQPRLAFGLSRHRADLVRRVIPADTRGPRRPFDAWGAASLTGAIIALVHGALGAAADGGWAAPTVIWSLAVAALLMTAFVMVERRAADPLVPLELFRSRVVTTGVALAVLGGAARASTFVLLALYLQLRTSPDGAWSRRRTVGRCPGPAGGFGRPGGVLRRCTRTPRMR